MFCIEDGSCQDHVSTSQGVLDFPKWDEVNRFHSTLTPLFFSDNEHMEVYRYSVEDFPMEFYVSM
jgi:hypothetical protein